MQNFSSEFDKRFLTLHQLSLLSSTSAFPFATDIDVDDIACKIGALFQLNITAVKMKYSSLQNDIEIKSRASTEIGKILELLLKEKYSIINRFDFCVLACFESTYPCESVFSRMKITKSRHRSIMTGQHLLACLRLVTTSHCPGYEELPTSCQSQVSH